MDPGIKCMCFTVYITFFLGGEQCCILGQIYGNVTSCDRVLGTAGLTSKHRLEQEGKEHLFIFPFAVGKGIIFQFFF